MGRGSVGANLQSGEGAAVGGGRQIWVPVYGEIRSELLCVVTRCNNTTARLFIYFRRLISVSISNGELLQFVKVQDGNQHDVLQWNQVPPSLFIICCFSLIICFVCLQWSCQDDGTVKEAE